MIRVNVINKDGVQQVPADFPDMGSAQVWVNQLTQNGVWGKPERWVREGDEDISGSLETRQTLVSQEVEEVLDENDEVVIPGIPAVYVQEYKLPSQFSVEFEDIASLIQQESRNQKLKQLRELRDKKLLEADVMVNELVLQLRSDREAIAAYRQSLLQFTDDYRYVNDPDKAKAAIDSLDLDDIDWPEAP